MRSTVLFALALLAACAADPEPGPEAAPAPEPAAAPAPDAPVDAPAEPACVAALDLLLVVDDSGSMCLHQAALAEALAELAPRLAGYDLRTAVITTDMRSEGAMGRFQVRSAPPAPALNCVDADGAPFVADTAACDERAAVVAHGSDAAPEAVAAALGCQVTVGTMGDGFEAGLGALTAALACDGPNAAALVPCGGAGFLRPGAELLIVIAGDEDDCTDGGGLSRSENSGCVWHPEQLTPVAEHVAAVRAAGADMAGIAVAPVVAAPFITEAGPVIFTEGEAEGDCADGDLLDAGYAAACCPEGVCPGRVLPVCGSERGAAFGAPRYLEFAAAFGGGLAGAGICGDMGLSLEVPPACD